MKHRFLIILLVLATSMVLAQEETITFEAKVSKNTLGLNERLRIDFTMNKDGDNFTPPPFTGFKVVGGPNQSISTSWINGKRTYNKTYSYFLGPTIKGTFTIKQASIEIEGKTYKTTPLQIEVTDAVNKPSDEINTENIAEESLFLVAEISKVNPYLNEAVSITYKLYVGHEISVNDFRPLESPKYNNFWSQDIPINRYKIENGTFKDKPFRYVVLKRVVLYPQTTGKLDIEPLLLDVDLDVPTNKRDFFGGRLMQRTNKTVSAGNHTINVKPLPTIGKPDNFTGAVGDFTFNVTTSKNTLNASESLQAKVEISGKGNLKLFERPKLSLPSSLEVYEPEFEQSISTQLSGMQGKVWDSYTIVPQYKGKYPIPPVTFSYFDPKEERYKTLTSQEIIINVLDGPTALGTDSIDTDNSISTVNKKNVVSSGDQFRYLKLSDALISIDKKPFFGSKYYYLLLLLPLLIIPAILLFFKRKEQLKADIKGSKHRKANKLARKYLSEAKKTLGNKEVFYIALEKALHNYLKAKLHIETTDFSKDKIQELLFSKKVEEPVIHQFIALLKSCEQARYAPSSNVVMQQDYEKASQIISAIDRHI